MLVRLALAPWLGAVQVPAPPEPALEWAAPPECPDRAAVETAISRRLGRALRADEARVEGRVVRDGARGFSLQLRLTAGARGETREVADPSCAALADAVAVLVAAAVEPAGAVPVPEPAPEAEPAPEPEAPQAEEVVAEPLAEPFAEPSPPPAPEPAPAAMEDVPPRRSKGPGGFVRLQGGGELGALPGATGAVGLAGGLLGRRWRVELHGLYAAPQVEVRDTIEVRVGLLAGAVHGCGRLGRGPLEIPLCLGLEAGAMRGEARGLPSGRAAYQGWLAGVVGASAVWHASARWGLWAGLQLAVTPVYPRFELSNSSNTVTLWTPGLVSGRLLFGVEVRLGDPW